MTKYHLFSVLSAFLLLSMSYVSETKAQQSVEGYANADRYAVVTGRITKARILNIRGSDMFEGADYKVTVTVARKIRGNGFALRKFDATVSTLDIDQLKTRNLLFVLEKNLLGRWFLGSN